MKTFITLCVSLFATFAFAGVAFAATSDYTDHYTFDEGTGLTVGDSAGGKNGTLTGTSTKFGWASGMVGTALEMGGTTGEGVVLPDGFLSGSTGSIALWLKIKNLSDRNVLFAGRSSSDTYIYAALQIDHEGRPQFLFRQTIDGSDQKAQGGKILNTNEWYQLVLTADSQTYHMYINGEEATITGYNIGKWFPDLTTRTLMYRIGSLDSSPLLGAFDGFIDDVRIYNRVLSQDDVTALYNGGKPGTPGLPLSAQSTVPTTVVVLTSATTTAASATSATTTAANVSVSATSATTTTATSVTSTSVGATVVAAATAAPAAQTQSAENIDSTRKALIQTLINQILALIAELQKQLAALKAQGA